jgi:hypothetical protein
MSTFNEEVEKHRKFWAEVARKNGWYTEPFYVQVFVDADENIVDSVSFIGMTADIVMER